MSTLLHILMWSTSPGTLKCMPSVTNNWIDYTKRHFLITQTSPSWNLFYRLSIHLPNCLWTNQRVSYFLLSHIKVCMLNGWKTLAHHTKFMVLPKTHKGIACSKRAYIKISRNWQIHHTHCAKKFSFNTTYITIFFDTVDHSDMNKMNIERNYEQS